MQQDEALKVMTIPPALRALLAPPAAESGSAPGAGVGLAEIRALEGLRPAPAAPQPARLARVARATAAKRESSV